jgi:hypothetical protein
VVQTTSLYKSINCYENHRQIRFGFVALASRLHLRRPRGKYRRRFIPQPVHWGGTFYLLAGTNLAAPFSQWTRVWTNSVNTAGINNFSAMLTTAINSGVDQFYILQS